MQRYERFSSPPNPHFGLNRAVFRAIYGNFRAEKAL
jgi:hypothetical protein